jgi:hypothetical protein
MPMAVEISKYDIAKLDIILAGIKNGAVKILVRSLNKTLTSVKSNAAKSVAQDLNVTQKRVKSDFKKSHKASWNNPTAGFVAQGKPLPLVDFIGTRQVKKGVSVKIKKSGAREIIKHAFKGIIWAGKEDVGQRIYEGERQPARGTYPYTSYRKLPFEYRWPLRKLTGPRVEDELGKSKVIGAVMAYANERLNVILEQEVNYELSKLK